MNYHRIEKGLALSEPRPGFGEWAIEQLLRHLDEYLMEYGQSNTTQIALNALDEYLQYHKSIGIENLELARAIEERRSRPMGDSGGTLMVQRKDILKAARIDLDGYYAHRHSVRHFSDEAVSIREIERAVRMAQCTPSVCNRQSGRVHVYSDPEGISSVLACQNGNRGFGHQIGTLLLVTADISRFVTVGERNQCWVDGGMFAVTLLWALHSLGLGTCALNCSNDMQEDRVLRDAASIPGEEAIITMIAVGHLPAVFRVAQSPRLELSDVIRKH